MKILLACNGGFSTSILVNKIKEAAQARNIEIVIDAVAETDVEDYMGWDILLLGPQIGHRMEEFSEIMDMPVFVVDSFQYGSMDGEAVLEFIIEKLNKGVE